MKIITKFKLCCVDINCHLKVEWEVSGTSDSFLSSLHQLKLIVEDDEEIYAISEMHISAKKLCFSFIISF